MKVNGDFINQQGKNISYRKGGSDGWFKLIAIGIIAAVIGGAILHYLGFV